MWRARPYTWTVFQLYLEWAIPTITFLTSQNKIVASVLVLCTGRYWGNLQFAMIAFIKLLEGKGVAYVLYWSINEVGSYSRFPFLSCNSQLLYKGIIFDMSVCQHQITAIAWICMASYIVVQLTVLKLLPLNSHMDKPFCYVQACLLLYKYW